MLKYYYLFNQIFRDKNMKFKNLFKILHKVNAILSFIIHNFITNLLIILSIFHIYINNKLNINMDIPLTIFKHMFFYLWKVS